MAIIISIIFVVALFGIAAEGIYRMGEINGHYNGYSQGNADARRAISQFYAQKREQVKKEYKESIEHLIN